MKDDYVNLAERLEATAEANGGPTRNMLLDAAAMLRERGEQAKRRGWEVERLRGVVRQWEVTFDKVRYANALTEPYC